MRVVICGGGVIGACTAYFLSRRGIDVIVVERTEVAAAASGKAGGFLALDWCAGSPLDALARRSFALHAALPNEVAGDWGYRRMTAYSGFVVPEDDARRLVPAELVSCPTASSLAADSAPRKRLRSFIPARSPPP
jgi:glycine/D-amino acid oxidase-like deaminating enzyme